MEPRRNLMRIAHRNYSEFQNSAYGTEDPPPDYPGSGPNNVTPGIPSINQSEVSNQVSSAYGPVVDRVSNSIEDERNPRSLNGDRHGLYDNNDPQPLSQVPQRPPYVVPPPYDEIDPDYPASIKEEKKRGSCRKSKVVKVIIIAAMLVVIPLLVAMSYLFPRTDDLDKNPVIINMKTSMQLQQGELSSIKTYLRQRYPDCCGNRVNITVGDCVRNCTNITDGRYQSCKTCYGFVVCTHQRLVDMNCPKSPDGFLSWDDSLKTCAWNSSTCQS